MPFSRRQWLLGAAAIGAAGLFGYRHGSIRPLTSVGQGHRLRDGQWIWTAADADLYQRTLLGIPTLEAAAWLGTVSSLGGSLRLAPGLPIFRMNQWPSATVLRLDDSLHALWERHSATELARLIEQAISPLLERLRVNHRLIPEVQLDYDAPVSKLSRYAEAVRQLKGRCFAESELWVTSLPSHLESPAFGEELTAVVRGHVLQLFDTGQKATPKRALLLRHQLERVRCPFRYGVGTFERAFGNKMTDHRAWLKLGMKYFDNLSNCEGRWIFAAGQPYQHWLELARESEQ